MDALEAARAVLPTWVRLGPWLWGPVLGLLGTVSLLLVSKQPQVPEEPWWEKARAVFPVRQFLFSTRLLWLVVAIMAASTGDVAAPAWWRWHFTLACAWFPPLWVALRFEARLRAVPLRGVVRSWAALAVAGYGHAYFLVTVWGGSRLGGLVGLVAAVVGFVGALWLTSGGNLQLAEWLGLARPADERTRTAVERASARRGVKLRGVVELDWAVANALAYPLVRRVAFTRRAVEMLNDAELEAVAAHELGHLDEPWAIKATRPISMAVAVGLLFVLPGLAQRGLPTALLAAGVAVVVMLLALRARRRGEQHADAQAHDTDGTYAGVLEKLYRANLVPPVLRRGGAHGHLYDRLVAAGQPPSWPRPAPPERMALGARLTVSVMVVAVIFPVVLNRTGAVDTPERAHLALALGDASGWTLEVLAREAALQGRGADAIALYLGAETLLPGAAFLPAARAIALLNGGRCQEAAEVVRALEARDDLDRTALEALRSAEAALPSCASWNQR